MDLRWHRASVPADLALARHLRTLLGAGAVHAGRLCPRCGSAGHGRPWARHDGVPVEVSLSRSGDHLLTAAAAEPGAPVGVDVESVSAVARHWDPALVLADGELAGTAEEQARTWVRKEAVLKAYGEGLSRPMTELALEDFDGILDDVPAPPGHVAAVAVLRAGAAARSQTPRRRTAR